MVKMSSTNNKNGYNKIKNHFRHEKVFLLIQLTTKKENNSHLPLRASVPRTAA